MAWPRVIHDDALGMTLSNTMIHAMQQLKSEALLSLARGIFSLSL